MSNPNQDDPDRIEKKTSRRVKWLKRIAISFLVLIVIWLIADLSYSTIVRRNILLWESSVSRNTDGVLEGCEAYAIGDESSDTAILLVHGINDSPHVYRNVAPYLAKNGFYCRCMRVEGFGESVENYAKADIEDWLYSVEQEVNRLQVSLPENKKRKIILVGHSLGGAISIRYVSTNEDRVDALVLAAPAVDVSSARSPVFPVQFWHSILGATLIFTDTTQSPFGIDVLDPAEKESEWRTPFTPIKVIDQTFELVELNRRADQKIKVPVMMCLASKDRVIDNEAAKEFFERLPTKTKTLQVLDNSAHALLFDYQWKDFADYIIDFAKNLK